MSDQPGSRIPTISVLLPSDQDVLEARRAYAKAEPRDIVYAVSRDLIEQAYAGQSRYSRSESVALLLMSWNAVFYRPRPQKLLTLCDDLDRLVDKHARDIETYRGRLVSTYSEPDDASRVAALYADFVSVLWPVGSAKALHVLAPAFFPIWDTYIAAGFRLLITPPERSIGSYLGLMQFVQRFAAQSQITDPVKALDEWAFVRFTLPKRAQLPSQ